MKHTHSTLEDLSVPGCVNLWSFLSPVPNIHNTHSLSLMYSQCPITSLLGNNIVCHGFCLFVYASVGWFARFHKNILLSLGLWQTITNSPPDLMTEIARLSCLDNAASWTLEKHKFMFIYILFQLTFLTHEFLTSIYIFEKQRKREKERKREQEWESERKRENHHFTHLIPKWL